jgi:hypothetical protein
MDKLPALTTKKPADGVEEAGTLERYALEKAAARRKERRVAYIKSYAALAEAGTPRLPVC